VENQTPFDDMPEEDAVKPEKKRRSPEDAPESPRRQAEPGFFARVAAIPAADWGTRVYLYLYQLEPVCDLKQSGGKSYLMRYQEPVRDEHQIMLEQGSGKYRLMLALNKISANQSNELAQYNFEIYNPQYPPKVPREVWVNDPRNRRWEALLPKEKPQPAGGTLETFVDVMRATNDIRREIKQEMTPAAPPADPNAQQQQQAAAAVDPWSAAEKILNMRADNPMMAILQQQMKDSAAAAEAERQRAFTAAEAARDREFKLQQQLLELKGSAPAAKGLLEQLMEFGPALEKLEPLKKLFGLGAAPAEVVGRAVRRTTMDYVMEFAETPTGQAVGQGLASLMVNLSQRGATPQPPQQNGPIVLTQANSNGTVPPAETRAQRLDRIGRTVGRTVVDYVYTGETGAQFAAWMHEGMTEDCAFMRSIGPDAIMQEFRTQAPQVIAPRESQFEQFFKEFCAWDPNEDEAPAADAAQDDGVRNLDDEEDTPENA
jgi:hypothetical protein